MKYFEDEYDDYFGTGYWEKQYKMQIVNFLDKIFRELNRESFEELMKEIYGEDSLRIYSREEIINIVRRHFKGVDK